MADPDWPVGRGSELLRPFCFGAAPVSPAMLITSRRPSFIALACAVFAALALNACTTTTPVRRQALSLLVGPYKDVTIAFDPQTGLLSTDLRGARRPVADVLRPGQTLTWAFANGECGAETLGGLDAQAVATANVPALVNAGIGYVISTGGQAGVFTCSTDEGMAAFIARYDSPRLVGIDFDIESQQSSETIDALVRRAVGVQRARPQLRLSFTLATLAASDGTRAGLNPLGQSVVRAMRRHGLDATINLMVMDYGAPTRANCVVARRGGTAACDMGLSAIQAAENLNGAMGVPFDRIAMTAMVGVNDAALNETYPKDFEVITRYAVAQGMAGIHFWALDRDQPCTRPAQGASPLCSGLEGVPAAAFAEVLGHLPR